MRCSRQVCSALLTRFSEANLAEALWLSEAALLSRQHRAVTSLSFTPAASGRPNPTSAPVALRSNSDDGPSTSGQRRGVAALIQRTAQESATPATSQSARKRVSLRQLTQAQAASSTAPAAEPKAFHAVGNTVGNTVAADNINIKAQVVFEACWRKLEDKYKDRFQCPAEIVWLNGAPGAGKGVNTPWIMESRGLSRSVSMSSWLQNDKSIKEVMDRGELIPDTMVGDGLLEVIFNPEENDGAGLVMDGFPRTALQVDFLKLLYDKMMALHLKHADGPDEWRFPRPSFKVVVLYVEMEESIRRQMLRAQSAIQHNRRAIDAGSDDLWELRATDIDAEKCRRRYETFRMHYSTLLRLKQYFPFSLIDAMGTLEDARGQIARELRYQSSLDLDEATYAAIRHLPLAHQMCLTSRQQLVHRLDTYCKRHPKTFAEVVKFIDAEVVPQLKRCSLAGHAEINTHARLFAEHPGAADMVIDVLSDRGFFAAHLVEEQVVPTKVDLKTGEIKHRIEELHHFRITFEHQGVRELALRATANATGALSAAIGRTFVPSHLNRERFAPRRQGASGPAMAPGGQPLQPPQHQQQRQQQRPVIENPLDPPYIPTLSGSGLERYDGHFGYEMVAFDVAKNLAPRETFESALLLEKQNEKEKEKEAA